MANDVFRTLVRAEYTLLSTPLRVADRVAAQRFPADSPLRVTLERGIDTLDALALRLLGTAPDTEAAPRSEAKPYTATPQPSAETDAVDDDAHSEPAPAPASAEDPGHADEIERVAEELREEQDEAPLSGELAAAPDDEKERMAELRARHLVEEFEAEQRARHERFEES